MPGFFKSQQPKIIGNPNLRIPQIKSYEALVEFSNQKENSNSNEEVIVILPVGCGKSGCITIAPFAFGTNRALVIAPNLTIADQLFNSVSPNHDSYFYGKCVILPPEMYPEPAEIRSDSSNISDLTEADIVITNIQQLQGAENKWLTTLPDDFFDLILFDEGHHNVAESWGNLRKKFPQATFVNFTATPQRADGQRMRGEIIYSFSIFDAIKEGYIKKITAFMLNPRTLRYVEKDGEEEKEISLEEVKRLGENNAEFRRAIVSSKESLDTIVDASILKLQELRKSTNEKKLKIIASALNQAHCIQIKEAYCAKKMRAEFIHSKEDSKENDRILKKLENHELDVIVQVRKLGEGFDHPYLAVAAVFSVFSNLSPFVQFIGRIMRVIEQNNPDSVLNQGVVVFHAGSNIAKRWEDFQEFTQADQEYFDQFLPLIEEDIEEMFSSQEEIEIIPVEKTSYSEGGGMEIRKQGDVHIEEIPLWEEIIDKEVENLRTQLKEKGVPEEIILKRIPVTKQESRRAKRKSLQENVKNRAALILRERNINHEGKELDKKNFQSNWVYVKSKIDAEINAFNGIANKGRSELSLEQIERTDIELDILVQNAIDKIFNGQN